METVFGYIALAIVLLPFVWLYKRIKEIIRNQETIMRQMEKLRQQLNNRKD